MYTPCSCWPALKVLLIPCCDVSWKCLGNSTQCYQLKSTAWRMNIWRAHFRSSQSNWLCCRLWTPWTSGYTLRWIVGLNPVRQSKSFQQTAWNRDLQLRLTHSYKVKRTPFLLSLFLIFLYLQTRLYMSRYDGSCHQNEASRRFLRERVMAVLHVMFCCQSMGDANHISLDGHTPLWYRRE